MATAYKSYAADRGRPTVWDALLAVCVLAAAFLLLLVLRPASSSRLQAEIVLDGELVASYDLMALDTSVTFSVEAPYPLTVEASHGRIRIAASACPGGDCLRTGWADQPGQQIICLPNKLIISLSGAANTHPGPIDGVTG